jgi:hypothetical protein
MSKSPPNRHSKSSTVSPTPTTSRVRQIRCTKPTSTASSPAARWLAWARLWAWEDPQWEGQWGWACPGSRRQVCCHGRVVTATHVLTTLRNAWYAATVHAGRAPRPYVHPLFYTCSRLTGTAPNMPPNMPPFPPPHGMPPGPGAMPPNGMPPFPPPHMAGGPPNMPFPFPPPGAAGSPPAGMPFPPPGGMPGMPPQRFPPGPPGPPGR